MQSVDTRGIEPMSHAQDVILRLREDRVTEADQRELFQRSRRRWRRVSTWCRKSSSERSGVGTLPSSLPTHLRAAMLNATLQRARAGAGRKQISSVELTQLISRPRAAPQSALNAFITFDPEAASPRRARPMQRIAQGDAQPLTGIPIAHKDIFCTQGLAHHLRLEDAGQLRRAL